MAGRETDADVLVVGGGPVGGAFALAAADTGRRVVVLDSDEAAPEHDPRVFALSRASEKLLRHVGVWQRMEEGEHVPYSRMRVWESGDGLGFDAADLGEPDLGHMVDAGALRRAVDAALTSHALVGIERGRVPEEIETGADHAQLRASRSGSIRRYRAQLVVAADGARSPMRGLSGIGETVRDYGQRAVVTHVRCGREDRELTAWQRFLPDGTLALLPTAPGCYGVVWAMDEARARDLEAGGPGELVAAMDEALEGRAGEVEELTAAIGGFPLRFLRADTYIADRLALMGDAAQVVHPLAGQGLNIGLADAASLAELIEGGGPDGDPGDPRLLGRYQRWRMGESRSLGQALDVLQRLFVNQRPGMSALRRAGLSLVGRTTPLRNAFARRALGISGAVPRLMR